MKSAASFLSIDRICMIYFQKQSSTDVLMKRCSENMQKIYRKTPMPMFDFKIQKSGHYHINFMKTTYTFLSTCQISNLWQIPSIQQFCPSHIILISIKLPIIGEVKEFDQIEFAKENHAPTIYLTNSIAANNFIHTCNYQIHCQNIVSILRNILKVAPTEI